MSGGPVPEYEGGFSRRTVAGIAIAATVSFAVAMLLTFFGRDLSRPPTHVTSTFSHSALGHRALAELLSGLGLGVVSRETRAGLATGPRHPLIVAEPDPARAANDPTKRLKALAAEALRREAPLVLVLPKWTGEPLPRHPGWVGALRLLPGEQVRAPLAALLGKKIAVRRAAPGEPLGCYAFWGEGQSFDVDLAPAQLLAAGPGLEALVRCRGGVLVGRTPLDPREPESPALYIVADPDVLNNRGLARADHAALAYGLLAGHLQATGVVFDETVHGFERASGLLAEVFRFPLSLVLLQMLLLTGAVLWAGMGRFGKPLPAGQGLPAGKDVLIDNTARLLALGGSGPAADSLARYWRQSVRLAAARLFLPADRGGDETREKLQQASDARGLGMNLATIESRLREPGDGVLALARAIHRWRLEITSTGDTDGERRDP